MLTMLEPLRRRGAPDLTVLGDARAVARHTAAWLAGKLNSGAERVRAVCLSGGTTPRLLYDELAQPAYRDAMPWGRIHWFWGDERFVPAADERSNYRTVQERLFERVPVKREFIHPIPTENGIVSAAAAYERELKRFYGAATLEPGRPLFDLTLLGVGADGHTASLFPGSPLLKERARWVAHVAGEAVSRITLTYPALESSRDVAFLVTGAEKREIMQRIVGGETEAPAAMLRPVGRVHWFLDRAAAPGDPV